MNGNYKLYQNEWQGISLIEISKNLKVPPETLAAEDIYNEFYKRLKENNYKFSEGWLEPKKNIGMWLRRFVDETEVKIGRSPKILSIGCGLGVVEEESLLNGYDIELQECQESSFDYLASKGLKPGKVWVTTKFNDLPSDTYDIVFVNGVVYAFNDELYIDLSKNAYRILQDGGMLIITDPYASLKNKIISMLRPVKRKLLGGNPSVFWGYIRTGDSHKSFAKREGFKVIKELVFDRLGQEYNGKNMKILGWGGALSNTISGQGFIFQKVKQK